MRFRIAAAGLEIPLDQHEEDLSHVDGRVPDLSSADIGDLSRLSKEFLANTELPPEQDAADYNCYGPVQYKEGGVKW